MDRTYTVVPDFLLDFDNLNLTEVVALSVIFGFSMDGTSEFRGSYSYLARKCKCSRQWAISTVTSLIEATAAPSEIMFSWPSQLHIFSLL